MKKLLLLSLILTGCSLMPSKWDLNQARVITDIRQEVNTLDCKQDPTPQLIIIEKQIEWFNYYSEFKDTKDIQAMMNKLQTTTQEFLARLGQGPVSLVYCQLKENIMTEQASIIGATIKGSL